MAKNVQDFKTVFQTSQAVFKVKQAHSNHFPSNFMVFKSYFKLLCFETPHELQKDLDLAWKCLRLTWKNKSLRQSLDVFKSKCDQIVRRNQIHYLCLVSATILIKPTSSALPFQALSCISKCFQAASSWLKPFHPAFPSVFVLKVMVKTSKNLAKHFQAFKRFQLSAPVSNWG